MPDRPPEDGRGYFALLAQPPMRALLLALRAGPLPRAELQARRRVPARTMRDRLEALEGLGLVSRRPLAGDRRSVEYGLTEAGQEHAAIVAEMEALAARLGLGPAFIDAIAVRRRRRILRGLLDGPQSSEELLRIVPGLNHATLSRDLTALRAGGLAAELGGGPRGASVHELTELVPQLRRVLLLAASWRWRWTPRSAPRMAGDLAGLVHLTAPFVALGPEVRGRVELHVEPPPGSETRGWPDVEVAAAAGRIAVVEFDAGGGRPDARVEGEPLGWCEALCGGGFGALRIEGERGLAEAVLAGLAQGLEIQPGNGDPPLDE